MIRRIMLLVTVALVMAAIMLVTAIPAFAFANPNSNSSGQGQPNAVANCTANVAKQLVQEVHGETGSRPTNCDHFYQAAG